MFRNIRLSAGHALVGVAIVVAVLAFIALVVTLGTGRAADTGDAASAAGRPAVTAEPTEAPADAEDADVKEPSPAAVPVDGLGPADPAFPELAPAGEGEAERVPGTELEVTIGDVEAITAEAQGPGEVAGPAVRAVITVRNLGASAMDTAPFLVQGSIGQDRQPAMPLSLGSESFPASIAPGQEGRAIVTFLRPVETPGPMLIGVGTVMGAPLATLVVE